MKKSISKTLLSLAFVLSLTILFSNTLFAQDNIIMRNNDVIKAKVTEVDVTTIKYQRFDNPDGPVYVLSKSDIYMILYANGTKDVMSDVPQDTTQQYNSNQQNSQGQPNNSTPQNTPTDQNNYNSQPANTGQPYNSGQQNSQAQPNNSTPQNTSTDQNYYNSQPANTGQPDNSGQQNYSGQQDNAPAPNYDQSQPQQQGGGVTMQTFYDQLSPYGSWVNTPNYGYVWVPNVGVDFTPYGTAGHWAFTDYGWTWVSDFPWGWAAFHYGRWYYDPYMGYAWIPNTVWGPAWVSWRSSEGYYGWAPMGPAGYEYPHDRWTFVNAGYITNERVYDHYERRENVEVIYNNTAVIQNNYVERGGVRYVAGPNRTEVEQVTHTSITPVRIVSSNQPGQSIHANGQLNMYHPVVHTSGNVTEKPAQVIYRNHVLPPALRTTVVHPAVNNNNINHGNAQPANNNRTEPPVNNTNHNTNNVETRPEPVQPAGNNSTNNQATEQHPAPKQQQNNNARPASRPQQSRPASKPKPAPVPKKK